MSNDTTPQRPWSPGPWTQDGDNVMAPRGYVVCHTAGPRKDARARAIATFPELYEAAVAYSAIIDELDDIESTVDELDDELDNMEFGEDGRDEKIEELNRAVAEQVRALGRRTIARKRLDAALAAALPPKDDTP